MLFTPYPFSSKKLLTNVSRLVLIWSVVEAQEVRFRCFRFELCCGVYPQPALVFQKKLPFFNFI